MRIYVEQGKVTLPNGIHRILDKYEDDKKLYLTGYLPLGDGRNVCFDNQTMTKKQLKDKIKEAVAEGSNT